MLRSHFCCTFPPPATWCIHTYRRRNNSSKRCHDSNTVQSNHANRHHQVLHLYIISYILYFICSCSVFLKSSFAAYMTRNKISNTSGNIFDAKPRVGVFPLRLKDFLGNCWKCGLAGGYAWQNMRGHLFLNLYMRLCRAHVCCGITFFGSSCRHWGK